MPVRSVPMALPCTAFPMPLDIFTPILPLPEITLPPPASVVPIWLLMAWLLTTTPSRALGMAAMPV